MLTTYQKRVVHNCFIKNSVFEPLFRGMKLEFFWIFFPKINFRILWHSKDFLTGRFSGHANFLGYEIKISTNSQRGIFSTLPRWSGLWIAGKSFQGIFEKLVLRFSLMIRNLKSGFVFQKTARFWKSFPGSANKPRSIIQILA